MSMEKSLALIGHFAGWWLWSVADLSWHKLCRSLNYESGINVWLYLIIKSKTWKSTDSGWSLSQVGTRLVVIGHRSEQGTRSWVWLPTVAVGSYWSLVFEQFPIWAWEKGAGSDWPLLSAWDQLRAVIGQKSVQGTSSWLWVGRKHMVVSPWYCCGKPKKVRQYKNCSYIVQLFFSYLCTYDLYGPVRHAFDASSIHYEGM